MTEMIRQSIQSGAVQRVHFLGDSITQGSGFVSQQQSYVCQVMQEIQGLAGNVDVQVYNHAVGGATSTDGLNRVQWCERDDHQAELVWIMFGLNDLNQGVSVEEYGVNLGAMIERLLGIGAQVVVCGPTPFAGREDELLDYIRRVADVAGEASVPFIECSGPFYEGGNLRPGMLWPDGVHLTAEGHQVLARHLLEHLFVEEHTCRS